MQAKGTKNKKKGENKVNNHLKGASEKALFVYKKVCLKHYYMNSFGVQDLLF